MSVDPVDRFAQAPMTWQQTVAVAITVALNALDGFDVLSISFAAPGIAREWGIDRTALGFVLGMELVGMALGSIVLGRLTDRIGRRPTILGCLLTMAAGMLLASTAQTLPLLCAFRILTGVGIGGMLAATNAAAAEHSNARRRALSVSLMVVGYPIGAVLGGTVVAWLLTFTDWRSIFLFGGGLTLCLIPIVLIALPETVPFLATRRGPGALPALNRALARLGHPAIDELPQVRPGTAPATSTIFGRELRIATLLVAAAYFCHAFTFYYTLKWAPKIVVDADFSAVQGASVLIWGNLGGALGGVVFGFLARPLGAAGATRSVLIGSVAAVVCFGLVPHDLMALSASVATVGFFTNAGIVGLYMICAETFPARLRATGTGFVIGVGRAGSAVSPVVAGALFDARFGVGGVSLVMALGSVGALVFLLILAAPRRLNSSGA